MFMDLHSVSFIFLVQVADYIIESDRVCVSRSVFVREYLTDITDKLQIFLWIDDEKYIIGIAF